MTARLAGLVALFSLSMAAPVSLKAQGTLDSLNEAIELMRSDVRANKADLIGRALALPDSQAAVFWPMYREYEAAFSKLADERVALIKEYLAVADTLTDAKAKSLMTRMYDLEARRVKLSRDTFNRFSKKLPAKTVAHFLQIDGFLNRVIDLQIAAALPEVK